MLVALLPAALLAVSLAAPSPAPPGADALASLVFLTGDWTGEQDGLAMEEVWIGPKAGTMLAMHRDVAGGKTVSFEFLRIDAGPDGVTYWASPRGKPPTPFRLVEVSTGRAVFENPDHAYPRRILYWRGDDGSLHARIEGTRDGKAASEEWTWRLAP
jgi:hypothetical protein